MGMSGPLWDGDRDVRDIVGQLRVTTPGVAALELPLRRNGLGQLGFHVRSAGTVAEVEPYGFAWQSGLRPGSRLLDVCKVALVTMTHEQMIDLLRTSVTVTVLLLPPHDDGTPRRSWSETVTRGRAEPQGDTEPVTRGHTELVTRGHAELQGDAEPVTRGHTDSVTRSHADSVSRGHTDSVSRGHTDSVTRGHTDSVTRGHADSVSRGHTDSVTWGHTDSVSRGHTDSVTWGHTDSVTRGCAEPPGDTEPTSPGQRGPTRSSGWHWGGKRGGKAPLPHGRRPVSFPDTPQPSCSPRPPSGSFSSPSPAACARYRWQPEPQDGDSSSGGVSSHEGTMERHKAEPLWHVPAQGWPPGTPRDSPGRQHKFNHAALEGRKPAVPVPKNVFGQPRLRASLRDLRPPRRSPKNIEAELRRLIDMDPPGDTGTPPGDTVRHGTWGHPWGRGDTPGGHGETRDMGTPLGTWGHP
ncbi:hypothetical protein AV530_017638 [Patagioenas fasciata monilis]|uniref:PDZ domain-containing protein n=1 Tax=Patagioenas fasciata monilis TaxID=372326 RepID=A0A1V4JX77_PATFA|nr:hypothetical protein AV530_017638 [Patagioenas fasciata monilis]